MPRYATRPLIAIALLALPGAVLSGAAVAQDRQEQTGRPPQRIRDVTLTQAGQRCPASTSEEVVVCHRLDEPYRIPKALRDDGPIPTANLAWGARTASLDAIGRLNGGVPDSCSPVGTAGQSGCALQINQQWAAERRAQRDQAAADASAARNIGQSGRTTLSDDAGSTTAGSGQ